MDNSGPTEPLEVRLSDVCRSCLTKADDMLRFCKKTEHNGEIITMLTAVGNIEIEINDLLPSYLCKPCEEKLRLSYDFQMLIQRSNEIIRECVNGSETVLQVKDVGSDEPNCDFSEISVDDDRVINPVVRTSSRKLLEVSPSEVEAAITECQTKYYVNTECIKCGFVTNTSRALSVHMSRLHKDMKDRWCSVCNLEFDPFERHMQAHSKHRFQCKFCGKKFDMSMGGHFFEHLRSHSSVKPYKCHICHKSFIASRILDKHLRVHMNNRLLKCSICPANFSVPKLLRAHILKHQNESGETKETVLESPETNLTPQNFCKICKKRVRSLEQHLKRVHNPEPATETKKKEVVLCTHCGKRFNAMARYRLHLRTHTGETPYKCQYCDKRMPNRNHLVLHERTHTGERPYVCNICGRSFGQTSALNTHKLIHTGRPVSCEICAKRFCRPAQLRLHMRQHTGEKPYPCPECDQAFKQQSHLSEHLKRHSDERPYKCSHCEKSFKQLSILKSHLTIHTGEKPFKCSQCPYACRQRYSLTQHMRQHSADAPDPGKPHFCVLCQKGYTTMAMLMSHNDLVHSALK